MVIVGHFLEEHSQRISSYYQAYHLMCMCSNVSSSMSSDVMFHLDDISGKTLTQNDVTSDEWIQARNYMAHFNKENVGKAM